MKDEKTLIDVLSKYRFRVKGHVEDEHWRVTGAEEFFHQEYEADFDVCRLTCEMESPTGNKYYSSFLPYDLILVEEGDG